MDLSCVPSERRLHAEVLAHGLAHRERQAQHARGREVQAREVEGEARALVVHPVVQYVRGHLLRGGGLVVELEDPAVPDEGWLVAEVLACYPARVEEAHEPIALAVVVDKGLQHAVLGHDAAHAVIGTGHGKDPRTVLCLHERRAAVAHHHGRQQSVVGHDGRRAEVVGHWRCLVGARSVDGVRRQRGVAHGVPVEWHVDADVCAAQGIGVCGVLHGTVRRYRCSVCHACSTCGPVLTTSLKIEEI